MRTEGAQAVDRALALLLRIVDDGGLNSLTSLSRTMGLAPATAYRLSHSLRRAGLIVPLGKGRFAVGPALALRQEAFSMHRALTTASRPLLRDVARATRSIAHVGVLKDDMVTYIIREGTDANGIFSQENKQLEAYCSGIGKVLLAGLPIEQFEDYLAAGPFVALTERTITDPATLRCEMQIVAQRGFASDTEEAALGIHCLAIPIRTPEGETIAALSLSRVDRPPTEELELPLLQDVRQQIEARLFGH